MEESRSNGEEVGVARVLNLGRTPLILACADLAAANLNNVLGANNGKWQEASELGVLLDSVLIIFLDVVGKVVNRNAVVFNILHNKLLRLGQLGGGQGIGTSNDRDDVASGSKALHELDIKFSKTADQALGGLDHGLVCIFSNRCTHPWPVGVMKYSVTWTRLSLKRGLRLMRDSSAKMSSYCLSRYPTISEKLFQI